MSDKPPKDDLDWLIRKLQESRDRHPASRRPHLRLVTEMEDARPQPSRRRVLRVIKGGLAASGVFTIWRLIKSRPLQAALVSFAVGAIGAAGLVAELGSAPLQTAVGPQVSQSQTPGKATPLPERTHRPSPVPAAPVVAHDPSSPPSAPVRSEAAPAPAAPSPGPSAHPRCTVELLKVVCVQLPGG
ncbi:MAG: hypothetical protein J2P29_10425 [Actinobacteria bacterium]|nr:hypothetical protein [Actinomycetota bacterium]